MSNPAPQLHPFKPSALNRFHEEVARLPGGGWWLYPTAVRG